MKKIYEQKKEKERTRVERWWRGQISPHVDPVKRLDHCNSDVYGQSNGHRSIGVEAVKQKVRLYTSKLAWECLYPSPGRRFFMPDVTGWGTRSFLQESS